MSGIITEATTDMEYFKVKLPGEVFLESEELCSHGARILITDERAMACARSTSNKPEASCGED